MRAPGALVGSCPHGREPHGWPGLGLVGPRPDRRDLGQRIMRELGLRMPCKRCADGRSCRAGGRGGGWDVAVSRDSRTGGPGGAGWWTRQGGRGGCHAVETCTYPRVNGILQEHHHRAGCCGLPMWRRSSGRGRCATGAVGGCVSQMSTGRGCTQRPRGRESPDDPKVTAGGGDNGPGRIFKAWTVGSSLGTFLAC